MRDTNSVTVSAGGEAAIRAGAAAVPVSHHQRSAATRLDRAERRTLARRAAEQVERRETEPPDLLPETLRGPRGAGLELLLSRTPLHRFEPGWLAEPLPPPRWADFAPPRPTGLQLLLDHSRYRLKRFAAQLDLARAQAEHAAAEHRRRRDLEALRLAHSRAMATVRARLCQEHPGLSRLMARVASGEPEAVEAYFERVLSCLPWPAGFPRRPAVLLYHPRARRLGVSWPLPSPTVVPETGETRTRRLWRTRGSSSRGDRDRSSRYADLIAQIVLRVAYELVAADRHDTGGVLDELVVDAELTARNPVNGRGERVVLASLAVSRGTIEQLHDVPHPVRCLQELGGVISDDPIRLVPVPPVIDLVPEVFRSIPTGGSGPRTDVTALSPGELELLARRLFQAGGVEQWTPRIVRPDFVVATGRQTHRNHTGWAELLIVLRRDRGPVPVSAFRPLPNAIEDWGVDRGVLATTSWFALPVHRLAHRDNRIQLVEGAELRHLALRHLGLDLLL
ncbi:MAG TPA: restriction endonuclease [Pseudonocardiaceae bacterium]